MDIKISIISDKINVYSKNIKVYTYILIVNEYLFVRNTVICSHINNFMLYTHLILVTVIIAGILLSVLFKKLTWVAALTGGILSFFIFKGAGFPGLLMLTIFFVTGVGVTSWQWDKKFRSGLAEKDKGRRKPGQVLANAGLPAVAGLMTYYCVYFEINAPLIIAACFASATADTVSSELGIIYGSRFYNILNFKKSQRGLNGVISVEGTLLGVAGSSLIALVYCAVYGWSLQAVTIIIAGTAGNIADSVMGATLEKKGYLNNDVVNFLNTCAAALTVCLLKYVM